MFNQIFSLLSALSLASAPVKATEPTPYFIDNNSIMRITCGDDIGTGFYVGPGLIATAHHVVVSGDCKVNDVPADVVYIGHHGQDFALLKTTLRTDFRLMISCAGVKEGAHYFASGFAEGTMQSVTQRLIGTRSKNKTPGNFYGMTMFRGSITQGQSGGPIEDDDGLVVAMINANTTDSITIIEGVSLSETVLCGKNLD